MEIVLTVLIPLGVLSLAGLVWGVLRLNGRVDNLEVARLDIDDEIRTLRRELENDISHIHREMVSDKDTNMRHLDKRLDNVWKEIHQLSK